MKEVIIYKNKIGKLLIMFPSGSLDTMLTAKKDVPTGVPFKIVALEELPNDWDYSDAWDIDEAELTDGVGE